jgi:hypothetical protein
MNLFGVSLGFWMPSRYLRWSPINASWLAQIEIVFSELQRKALSPMTLTAPPTCASESGASPPNATGDLDPIRWTYTSQKLQAKGRRQRGLQLLAKIGTNSCNY